MRPGLVKFCVSLALLTVSMALESKAVALADSCGDAASAVAAGDQFQVGETRECGGGPSSPPSSSGATGTGVGVPVVQAPPTKTVDCGPPVTSIGGGTPDTVEDPCRPAKVGCAIYNGDPVDPTITTVVTYVFDGTTWRLANLNCASKAAVGGGPALTGLAIREKAIELLPSVPIRSAPANGETFVNMQTLLWLDSPPSRSLGPVALLGHGIGIQITAQNAKWDFGDGDTESGPLGKPYEGDCATKDCPGFWGHDYTTVGSRIVTATVTWTAVYTLDGGAPEPVPGGPISRGSTTLPLRVREARAVLVPNPGD